MNHCKIARALMSETRKSDEFASIMELMSSLNLPTDHIGVCFGIALMAERARRCGEYDKFEKRMDFLNQIKKSDISTFTSLIPIAKEYRNEIARKLEEKISDPKQMEETIANVIMANVNKEGLVSIQATTSLDNDVEPIQLMPEDVLQLLSINAFFEQIWAHNNPDAIKEFLEIKGPSLYQRLDTYKIEQLIYDPDSKDARTSPLHEPSVYPLFRNSESGFEDVNLKLFLKSVQEAAHLTTGSDESVGLVISFHAHVIHLFYDKNKNRWQLTDHSTLTNCRSIDEVVQEITLTAKERGRKLKELKEGGSNPSPEEVSENQIPNLVIQLYSDNPPEALKNKLEEIVQASLTTACNDHNIQQRDSHIFSVLNVAVQTGRNDILCTLLETYPKIESDLSNALHLAVQIGRLELVETLLNAGAKANVSDSLVALAAKRNHMEIVETLVKNKVPGGEALLSEAVQKENFELIKTLLNAGVQGGVKLLYNATEKGKIKLVQTILEARIDPNKIFFDKTVLFVAAQKGYAECVELLLQYGADPKVAFAMPIGQLLQYGNYGENVKTQVEEYIKTNTSQSTQMFHLTPSHIAHIFGRDNIEKILLAHASYNEFKFFKPGTPALKDSQLNNLQENNSTNEKSVPKAVK